MPPKEANNDQRTRRAVDERLRTSRLSPGVHARKQRRKGLRQRKPIDLDTTLNTGSVFRDPSRDAIVAKIDEIDVLRRKQQKLAKKLPTDDLRRDGIKVYDDNAEINQMTKSRREQMQILEREEQVEQMRNEELQKQRQIRHNLEAAKKYQEESGTDVPLLPFYQHPYATERAKNAYKHAKSTIFSTAGPLEGKKFTIETFDNVRQAQLKRFASIVPNDLIKLEIERRLLAHYLAQTMDELIPYASSPILHLNPMYKAIFKLAKNPKQPYGSTKSIFLQTQYNPYRHYYDSLIPIIDDIVSKIPKLTQRSAKELIHIGKAELQQWRRDLYFYVDLQKTVRNRRLLQSRFRRVRSLARQCWLYTPPSTEVINTIKTTPVFFPNSLIRKFVLGAVGYKSTQVPSLLPQEDQAAYWLSQIPKEKKRINLDSSHQNDNNNNNNDNINTNDINMKNVENTDNSIIDNVNNDDVSVKDDGDGDDGNKHNNTSYTQSIILSLYSRLFGNDNNNKNKNTRILKNNQIPLLTDEMVFGEDIITSEPQNTQNNINQSGLYLKQSTSSSIPTTTTTRNQFTQQRQFKVKKTKKINQNVKDSSNNKLTRNINNVNKKHHRPFRPFKRLFQNDEYYLKEQSDLDAFKNFYILTQHEIIDDDDDDEDENLIVDKNIKKQSKKTPTKVIIGEYDFDLNPLAVLYTKNEKFSLTTPIAESEKINNEVKIDYFFNNPTPPPLPPDDRTIFGLIRDAILAPKELRLRAYDAKNKHLNFKSLPTTAQVLKFEALVRNSNVFIPKYIREFRNREQLNNNQLELAKNKEKNQHKNNKNNKNITFFNNILKKYDSNHESTKAAVTTLIDHVARNIAQSTYALTTLPHSVIVSQILNKARDSVELSVKDALSGREFDSVQSLAP